MKMHLEQFHSEPSIYSKGHSIVGFRFISTITIIGINTGCYYGIGTLLNPIILHYFPVSIIRSVFTYLLWLRN